jgi:hypothetical protein
MFGPVGKAPCRCSAARDSTIVNGALTEWHAEKGRKFEDGDLRD